MLVFSFALCYNAKMTVSMYRGSQKYLGGKIEKHERKG